MMRRPPNALGDVGNLVGMVMDFLTNVRCRGSAQRGLEWPHVGSIKRPTHGRDVMRLPLEGQEPLTDVHGTHVHEADPRGSDAIGVHDCGVQPCEEGGDGRRRRPMALRVGSSEQGWEGVGGSYGGGLALKKESGVLVRNEMPGGEDHGDVAARVHDDVLLLASGEPPTFEQRQHLSARLVDVDDAAAVGVCHIVQCPLRSSVGTVLGVSVSLLRATPSRAGPWVS